MDAQPANADCPAKHFLSENMRGWVVTCVLYPFRCCFKTSKNLIPLRPPCCYQMQSKLAKRLKMDGSTPLTWRQVGGQNNCTALLIWVLSPDFPKYIKYSAFLLAYLKKKEGVRGVGGRYRPRWSFAGQSKPSLSFCLSVHVQSCHLHFQTNSQFWAEAAGNRKFIFLFSVSERTLAWRCKVCLTLVSNSPVQQGQGWWTSSSVNGTNTLCSPTLQPQKVQNPFALDTSRVREHHLCAELAEFPPQLGTFGRDFECHMASELSAPSGVVTVLITPFCLKHF